MSTTETRHIVAADTLNPQGQSAETSQTETPNDSLYRDAAAEKVPVDVEQEDSSPRPITGLRWFLFLGSIYFVALLYGLDTTIVANIQGSLVEQFGEVEKLSWVGAGFPLGSVAVILSLGKAFGIFENKWLFIMSVFIFNVGSALCGAAPSMNALIIGRVIAGIGGAGDYLGCLNLVTRFTTLRERPLYISLIGLHWGVGAILGPVIGGAFADSSATWRWSFYINLVGCAVIAPAVILCIPPAQPQPGVSFLKKLSEFDWIGMVLNAGIYTSWVVAITFGGALWAWNDGRTIATFVVLGVLIIAMVIQQYFLIYTTVEHRVFPGELLKRRTPMLLFFAMNGTTAAAFIAIYFIPVYFQFVKGDSGLPSSVRLLPIVIPYVFSIIINGGGMPVTGYYMPWFVISGILITTGSALMYTVNASTNVSAIYGYSALIGIGAGLASQAGYSIIAAKIEPQLIPAGIAMLNVAQLGSIVHALAISGTVFQNYAYNGLKVALADHGFSDADIHAAAAGSKSSLFMEVDDATRHAAIDALCSAISRVYIIAIVGGAVVLLGSLFMRREKLFQKQS